MNENITDDCVRIVFRIKKECWEPTSESVGIVGNHARLGHWNTDLAPRTSFMGHGEWQLETWLPLDTLVYFKLFSVDPRSNYVNYMETIPNRELPLANVSLFIELEYDEWCFKVSKMTSQLTSSGNPFVLKGASLGTTKYNLTGDEIDQDFDDEDTVPTKLHSVCGNFRIMTRDRCGELETTDDEIIPITTGHPDSITPVFQMAKYDEKQYKSPLDSIRDENGKVVILTNK